MNKRCINSILVPVLLLMASVNALGAAIESAVLSLHFKIFWPALPFIDRVGLAFILCVAIGLLMLIALYAIWW